MNTHLQMVSFFICNKLLRVLIILNILCSENNVEDSTKDSDPRVLGLAMIPGKYIISISIDDLMMGGQGSPYVT